MNDRVAEGTLRQQAVAGGQWTALSAVGSVIIQVGQLAALGRLLTPADFGLMAMMMMVIGLALSLADFGVGNYIVQVNTLSRHLFWRLLALAIAMSFMLSVVIALTSDRVADYYNSNLLINLLPWLGVAVITNTVSQVYFALMQRALKFKIIAMVDIVTAALGLVVSVEMAWLGYGIWSLIAGQITVSGIKALIYSYVASKELKKLPHSCSERISAALRFGYFQMGEQLSNFVGWNMDKLIIGRLLGEHSLGIYSVAFQLMMRPISVLNPIFTRVSLPVFSQIKDDNERLCRGYLQVLRIITLLSIPIYLVLAIAAPVIIHVLLGDKWHEAAPVFSILCGIGLLSSLGNPIGTLIVAKGRADWAFYFNLYALFIYAVAYYLGSFFGILGVAMAFLSAVVFFLFPVEFFLRWKLIGMRASDYFRALKHQFIAASVPLLMYVIFCLNNGIPENYLHQSIAALCAVIFFGVYLWFTERELIKNTYSYIF